MPILKNGLYSPVTISPGWYKWKKLRGIKNSSVFDNLTILSKKYKNNIPYTKKHFLI